MAADYIQANTDGRLHPADEPSVPVLDRGFLYGDAIYEVWRTYEGVLFAWDDHWQRLQRSADSLFMKLPLTPGRCLDEIHRTVKAFSERAGGRPELYIRLQVTRGGGTIGLNPALADTGRFVLIVQSLKTPSEAAQRDGIRLALASTLRRNHPRTLNPAWKTGNYLNNILCVREAVAAGADEVVMSNLADEITESAVSNIGFIRNGELFTPPLAAGILEGITRARLLGTVAPALGVRTHDDPIPASALGTFDECFICSTTRELTPVAAIDGHRFKTGEGTVTRRLQGAFHQHALDEIRRHPERSVWA